MNAPRTDCGMKISIFGMERLFPDGWNAVTLEERRRLCVSRYLDEMKNQASITKTLNGAKTYNTTGDACLDLFSVAGGMRYRGERDQIALFIRAYLENPELAMKLLFYIRDIRGGMGERQTFRNLIRYTAKNWPESARKNVGLFGKYGRFDDLLCLMKTPAEQAAVDCIQRQLKKDLKSLEARKQGEVDAPISLLAKWLPSVNTSSAKTRKKAKYLAELLGMKEKDYRKMLSELRANICLTERYLTEQKQEKIRYEAVPAGAMLKYRRAFAKKDPKRLETFLKESGNKDSRIHGEILFPYEIVRPFFSQDLNLWAVRDIKRRPENRQSQKILEMLWKALPDKLGNENAVSVVDTSGSMYWTARPDGITPALISQSLGLYHAQRCKGVFHNRLITFESEPHLMKICGTSLRDQLRYIQSFPWGASTNLEAVFDLILMTAVKAGARQKDMPSVLYIISDMEFNCCIEDAGKTVYENAKEKFEIYGYEMPAVVFINVNSWQMQAPVKAHTKGTALMSGAGVSGFKHKFDGNITPLEHMLRVLGSERYREVHA